MNITEIPLDKIVLGPNVRINKVDKSIVGLMQSIKQFGLRQAIGLTTKEKDDNYHLLFGFRRYKAFKNLGWKTIPAVVDPNLPESEIFLINAMENLQRKEVTPAETGFVVSELVKMGLTKEEIAVRIGIPKNRVKNAASLYKHLSQDERDRIIWAPGRMPKEGGIPVSIALRVLQIRRKFRFSKKEGRDLMEHARQENYSGRQLEILGGLISQGMTVKVAARELENFKIIQIDYVLSKKELSDLAKKFNSSESSVIKMATYGLIPPLGCPHESTRKQLQDIIDGKEKKND